MSIFYRGTFCRFFLVSSPPLLAYHFNQVSLISPLVNILAVAIFGLAAMLAFVGALGVLMVPFIAAPFFLAAGFFCCLF